MPVDIADMKIKRNDVLKAFKKGVKIWMSCARVQSITYNYDMNK